MGVECSDSFVGFGPANPACVCGDLGGSGGDIPNPLPVTFTAPDPVNSEVYIAHIEGGIWNLWPDNVTSWSVTVESGTAVLAGIADGANAVLHEGDTVADSVIADYAGQDTISYPASIDVTNGRVLLNITYRP